MTPEELFEMARVLKQIGADVRVSADELDAYYPRIDEKSFYLPSNLPKDFYYDGPGLRKLSTVNSDVFRRLLGMGG